MLLQVAGLSKSTPVPVKFCSFFNQNGKWANFIRVDLTSIGLNLEKVKRNTNDGRLSRVFATHILIQMLDAIEETHKSGFIHRDIKAVRFMKNWENLTLYLVQLRPFQERHKSLSG